MTLECRRGNCECHRVASYRSPKRQQSELKQHRCIRLGKKASVSSLLACIQKATFYMYTTIESRSCHRSTCTTRIAVQRVTSASHALGCCVGRLTVTGSMWQQHVQIFCVRLAVLLTDSFQMLRNRSKLISYQFRLWLGRSGYVAGRTSSLAGWG
jgi:hypothetical protein